MLATVTTHEQYDSPRMRKLNHTYRSHRYKGMQGIRAVCMRLFDEGLTYQDIAAHLTEQTEVVISARTLGHYMARWRQEAAGTQEVTGDE